MLLTTALLFIAMREIWGRSVLAAKKLASTTRKAPATAPAESSRSADSWQFDTHMIGIRSPLGSEDAPRRAIVKRRFAIGAEQKHKTFRWTSAHRSKTAIRATPI